MPELPEVETTLRGIKPHLIGERIHQVEVRQSQLRWLIPHHLAQTLKNKIIHTIERRGKYLLLHVDTGCVIIHLGMSGRLCILLSETPPKKHDHVDIQLTNKKILRFSDPRKFGAVLWAEKNPHQHVLLKQLGPEPFDKIFSGKYLWQQAQNRSAPIKSFIMNNHIVVGIGNIYATEALFLAGISPLAPAKTISLARYQALVKAIKFILRKAIKQGGTTLKDFVGGDGKPGYFSQYLHVYGRAGLPCVKCKTELKNIRIGQRSTVYCKKCQQEQFHEDILLSTIAKKRDTRNAKKIKHKHAWK